MSVIYSLSLCGRIILDLHDLNNEGTEGNQQMTRMVWVVINNNQNGPVLCNVNAISGDMLKHIQAEHLHRLAVEENGKDKSMFPLSRGALAFDANRINSGLDKERDGFWLTIEREIEATIQKRLPQELEKAKVDTIKEDKQKKNKIKEIRKKIIEDAGLSKTNTQLADNILRSCAVTDLEGALVTAEVTGENRSLARKSCIEFGWAVGIPELTRTDTLFHVKYDPQGRAEGSGVGENIGQNIFHRPLNSGVYAIVNHLELYRVGRNDISLKYAVDAGRRKLRARALLQSMWYTFVKTSGAQRNTQHPHILGFGGAIAYSTSPAIPAPTASPLEDGFVAQLKGASAALNRINPEAVTVKEFKDQTEFGGVMADLVESLEVPPDSPLQR